MHAFSLDSLCSHSPSITQRNTSVQLNRIMWLCEKYIYLKFQILNHKALLRIAKSLILFSNLQKTYERCGPRALVHDTRVTMSTIARPCIFQYIVPPAYYASISRWIPTYIFTWLDTTIPNQPKSIYTSIFTCITLTK